MIPTFQLEVPGLTRLRGPGGPRGARWHAPATPPGADPSPLPGAPKGNLFNERRPHGALHGLTPRDAWESRCLPKPIAIRARDRLQPEIEIHRRHCRGDPRLPVIKISMQSGV